MLVLTTGYSLQGFCHIFYCRNVRKSREDNVLFMDSQPQELLKKAQSGDTQAFETLYNECFTPVYRYLYKRVRNKDDAMDLAQTVFVKLATTTAVYEIGNSGLLSYLFTVARNTLIDFSRKESHGIIYDDELLQESDTLERSDQAMQAHEHRDLMVRALQELDDPTREIMELRFVDGMKSHEIAQVVGKSEESVRQIQSRALKKLRELYKENAYE